MTVDRGFVGHPISCFIDAGGSPRRPYGNASKRVVRHSRSTRHPIPVTGRQVHPTKVKFPMAKTLTEIRSLARSHTRTALRVLVGVMRSKDATAAARVSAANAILDRGWGKANQAIDNGDGGGVELIHRIERVIVRPENADH
jgi:hypothetical protein